MSRDRASLVLDIMTMYDDLAYSFQKLKPTEREELKASDVVFPGFDGNYESEELGFAFSFIAEGNDRFLPLFKMRAGGDLNSHAPLISLYERQLEVLTDTTHDACSLQSHDHTRNLEGPEIIGKLKSIIRKLFSAAAGQYESGPRPSTDSTSL